MLAPVQGKELEVYAVWFSMFPGDSRAGWPSGLLSDERVRHFWDENKIVGTWYGENITQKSEGHVEWDAYFLYTQPGSWQDQQGPSSWGRTIVQTREQLKAEVAALFEPTG